MASDARRSRWFTEPQVLVALTLLVVVLAAMAILPYIQYIVFGAVLAYVFWPLRERLVARFRRDVSALLITLLAVFVIFVPFVYLLRELTRQAVAFAETAQEVSIDYGDVEATLLEWGITIDVEETLRENQQLIGDTVDVIGGQALSTAQSLPGIVIGLVILTFVLFVLLRDGQLLVHWTRTMLPIRRSTADELFTKLDRLMWASIVGNIAAGAIQAVALGAVFWVLGFDTVLFLTVLTFVLALLPLVGAFAVWVPAVVYLALTGQTTPAVIVLLSGLVISASDFYTRPLVIGHSAGLNSAIIVIGVFGGIVAFGPVGLVIGPVAIGGAKITIEVLIAARNRDTRITSAS